MKRRFTIVAATLALLAIFIAPMGMWGQTKATYKLQQVTSVSAGNKYVFVQSNHAMSNSVSSNALQTTASYSTTGLSGTESYVWTLESATGGFYMKNVSLSSSSYLLSVSGKTNVSFGSKGNLGIWSFSFSSGVATISAVNNSSRFLGYTSSTSYEYKAYATSNLSTYDHDITVYQLVEEVNYTITAQSNNTNYGTVSLSGKIITATPNSGYRVSTTTPYSVSPSGSATVVQNGNLFTVTPSANTTVTINFEAVPAYTVTLGDNNETLTETSAGAGVTLPTRSDVSPYTFAGWSTTNNQTETTTAPTIISVGTYHPTSNITLYPVYTRTEGEEVMQWQKVSFPSSGSSLSGTYALLTPDGHAFNGSISGGHGQVTSTAFAFNSSNVATSVPSDVCELTFESVSGGFKIKKAGTSQYLYATAASSGSLSTHSTESSYWRSTGSNLLYNSNSAYLRAYNNGSFRTYSSSGNGSAITFAQKVQASVSVNYYISVVAQPEPSCEITPDIYEFGNVAVGSTHTTTFTVNTENLEGDLTVSIDHTADGFSVSPTTIASTATTTTLTVTFAPSAATADLTATLTISGGGLEDDVEALISGTAVQAYTVTFNCNGGMAVAPQSQTALSGNSVSLPYPGNLTSDFVFVGWTLDPAFVEDGDILHAGESVTVTGNEIYYAVYSHSVFLPTGDAFYELVTEDLEDWSGKYLIVYEEQYLTPYAFDGSLETLDASLNRIQVTIADGRIEYDDDIAASCFTIASMSGGYSIKSASGYYIGRQAASNGMNTSTTTAIANAISFENGYVNITGTGTNTTAKLQYYNHTSGQERFRYYTSSQKSVKLYKYIEEGTTTTARYTRVFLNETASDDIVIVGPSIIPSGYSLNMDEYELVNEYDYEVAGDLERAAANLVIEEGAQLIHNGNWDVPATMQKNITAYSGETDNYYLMSLPFDSYDIEDSPFVTVNGNAYTGDQNYDFFRFDGSQTQEEWQIVGTEDALEAGVGFLYANNVGGTLNLTGTLVSSNTPWETNLDYDATKTFGGWNLIGNPFACNAQTDYNASFYVISGNELTPSTTGIVAPLQGIFVKATGADQSVTFSRVGAAKWAQALTVNIYKENASKSAAVVDRAIVRFDESMDLEKFQLNPNHTKVYFTQGNKDYAVVRSNGQGEMPVSFKAEKSGIYTFNVETENVEMSYLHLFDNKTGADVDLLATPSYTFNANTSDNVNRFRLVFKANADVEENAATETFAYFNGSEWVINNSGNATLQVIDMMGRVLSSETISGNANVTLNQVPGVYMFRLVNGNDVKVQKVVVR